MLSDKKATLNLPLKLILSEAGLGFFLQRKKTLQKFKTASGLDQYGLTLLQFKPPLLQRMIMLGYVSSLEISRPEFSSRRSDVMDLSQLIYYGLLYQRFGTISFDRLSKSRPVREWILHAEEGRTAGSNPNSLQLAEFLKRESWRIKEVKHRILTPLGKVIESDSSSSEPEKRAHRFTAEKFCDNIRSLAWYFLLHLDNPQQQKLCAELTSLLSEFLKKTSIADFFSLLLMELNSSTEFINMRTYAERMRPGMSSAPSVFLDPSVRHSLLESMQKDNVDITISWHMGTSSSSSLSLQERLQILIYGRNTRYHELQEKILQKMTTRERERSLNEFYESNSLENSHMGLEYLTFLNEACKKVNIRLSSRVSQITETNMTEISLSLQL